MMPTKHGLQWVAVVSVWAACAHAAGPPAYTAYRLKGPVTIDGKPDEAAWSGLPLVTGFRLLGAPKSFARKQSWFRIGWDASHLYVMATCDEPDVAQMKLTLPDGAALWIEDSLEFFFVIDPPEYQQFVVSPAGKRTWVAGGANWRAAASRTQNAWRMEMAVPLAALDVRPKAGDTWRFNVARNQVTANHGERHATWGGVEKRLPRLAQLRRLAVRQ